jgi:hypothetical protein
MGFRRARETTRKDELKAFKELAAEMLNYDSVALAVALRSGALIEVANDEQATA